MNYVKVYIDFIKTRLDQKIIHDEYYERHHIIPRSIFDDLEVQNQLNVFGIEGKWSKKNIIELTGREHFFAHELLQAMNISQNQKIKMTYALNILASRGLGRTYETFKKEFANVQRHKMLGKPSRQKGNKWSKESRAKAVASSFLRGKTYEEAFGEIKAQELKRLRSEKSKKRGFTKEMIEKRHETIKNKSKSEIDSWYKKISEANKGKKRSEEWIKHLTEERRDRNRNKIVDQTLFKFKNVKTGEEVIARRIDMRKDYGCSKVHELIDGRKTKFKGWIFVEQIK